MLAGTGDLNQLSIIFDLVGSPTEKSMPGWDQLPGCEGFREFASRPSTIAQRFRQFVPLRTEGCYRRPRHLY